MTITRRETTAYAYDATGIRVSSRQETDADGGGSDAATVTTTTYLSDRHNPTGYAQTLEEVTKDATDTVTKRIVYTIGHDQISQTVYDDSNPNGVTHTFHADGHGSTRLLTNAVAAILQHYAFDAHGNALSFDPAVALTSYLYSGEQFDSRIGQQYLRARWYDATTGRFNRLDPFFGNVNDPQSLHKYLYVHGDPVNGVDPSGRFLGVVMTVLPGIATGLFLRKKYDSNALAIGGGIAASGLAYLGFIALGSITRNWLGGHTNTVNIYVTPLEGAHAGNQDFVSYRSHLLANRVAVETRLNDVNKGNTTFHIIDGAPTAGVGYDKRTKTMNIRTDWRDQTAVLAQGKNWKFIAFPLAFKQKLEFSELQGLISVPIDDDAKSMYLGNLMLHEIAHVVLERNPYRQWGGLRDHTASGLMGGPPYGGNMHFDVASQRLLDYDEGTKSEMRAAFGYEWAWW